MAAFDADLKGVIGDKTAKRLAKELELGTVGDLLRHYPRRYFRHGELTDLAALKVDDQVTVLARVEHVRRKQIPFRGNRRKLTSMVEVMVTDGSGRLQLTFFQAWAAKGLEPGVVGLFAGKVTDFRGQRQLTHPECRILGNADPTAAIELAEEFVRAVIPIYPATGKLASWVIQGSVEMALGLADLPPDLLPEAVRRRHGLVDYAEALYGIHRPEDMAEVGRARTRLKWDEAFVLQVELARRRRAQAALPATPRVPKPDGLLAAFDARLPFTLTEGQQQVGERIAADLALEQPMNRLLQGEVGSGKTVCAVRAMLAVVDAGGQAALLAPTEVLAQQHHRSITEMLGPLAYAGQLGGDELGTEVALLTGSATARQRRQALLDAACGRAGIVIGTHALLQEQVQFADLGLVVIDEQHRFGVEQRDVLRAKGGYPPHVLVMTATPIPRTVAMTVYGDLDVSTLSELPRGRSPITTHVAPGDKPAYLVRAWERIREEVAAGHQAYVVCPRIGADLDDAGPDEPDPDEPDPEESGLPAARPPLAVTEVHELLAGGPFADLRTEILHGRLPPDRKDAIMRAYAAGEIDVLVSTTVIEVGVDVPNATVMVVMDAERFGIAQLHQLRGRIGRGSAPGLCLLVTDVPPDHPSRERLDAVAATLDGFELSRHDLEQRREGTILSGRQHGRRDLRLLTLQHDEDIIRAAREEAIGLVASDGELAGHPALRAEIDRWLGQDADYLEKA